MRKLGVLCCDQDMKVLRQINVAELITKRTFLLCEKELRGKEGFPSVRTVTSHLTAAAIANTNEIRMVWKWSASCTHDITLFDNNSQ